MINGYKIGCGINYWDDPFGLINLSDEPSFYRCVDKIYLINGRYKGRKDSPESDPRILHEILVRFPKVELIQMEDEIQINKRNKYWECAERDNLDFMLVIDSDEKVIITGEFRMSLDYCINHKEQCYPIVETLGTFGETPRPRLFKKPFNFRHKINENSISHGSVYNPEGKEIIGQIHQFFSDNGNFTGLKGIRMEHNKKYRTKKRLDWDYQYYNSTPTR